MPTYFTGSSNYPQNYDVVPTGAGMPSVSYVLDEIRNSQGVITQSGDAIVALQVNEIYTILQSIEETLGTSPQGAEATVADRLTSLEATGSFLRVSGGSMFGDINMESGSSLNTNLMSGSGIVWTIQSGISIASNESFNLQNDGPIDLVALSNSTFTITGNSVNVFGYNVTNQAQNLITINGLAGIRTSGDVYPITSGLNNLGSTVSYYSNLYANSGSVISLNSTSVNTDFLTAGTGSFHAISGLSPIQVLSDLNLVSGVNLTTSSSGIATIGDYSSPFSSIYAEEFLSNDDILIANSGNNGTNLSVATNNAMLLSAATGSMSISAGSFISLEATGIKIQGNVELSGNIVPPITQSGLYDIGTALLPFRDIYVDNIYSPSLAISGMALTTFVTKSGSEMTGALNMSGAINMTGNYSINLASGSNIENGTSGVNSLGSPSNPFSGIFANNINSSPINRLTFNESLSGDTDGVNKQYYFSQAPNVGSAMVFVSGLLISTAQYAIAGSGLLFSVLAPGQSPISTYGHI